MIRSLLIYLKFITKSALSAEERKLLTREWQRTYSEEPSFKEARDYKVDNYRIAKSLYMAVEWLLRAQLNMTDYGFGSYRIGSGWTSSYPENHRIYYSYVDEICCSEK